MGIAHAKLSSDSAYLSAGPDSNLQTKKPQPQSLRQAIEALTATAGNGMQLATALVRFQSDLVAAQQSRLIGATATTCIAFDPSGLVSENDIALCARALAAGTTIAEPLPHGTIIATPLGFSISSSTGESAYLVGIYELPKATPLTLALAQERLELSAAIARAHVTGGGSQKPDETANAGTAFAQNADVQSGLEAAADRIKSSAQATEVVIGTVRRGKITHIAHTSGDKLSASARQKYALALGETLDFGGKIECGGETGILPPGGIAAAFGTAATRGRARVDADGNGVAILIGQPQTSALVSADVSHLYTAVLARIYATGMSPRIDRTLAKFPPLAKLAPEKRLATAKKWALAGAVFLCILPVPDSVSGSMTIEPKVRRLVSAPIMSRIEKVHVQPGDSVIAGKTILVSLDTQNLMAERDQMDAALQSAMADASMARNEGDPDRERAAQLRAEQAQAQVALVDYRLSEANIAAPISGIVMGEDLRRREGAQLNRGDPLMEIATPGAYRAEMLIPDQDIDKVTKGASVSMHLDAFSLKRFKGKVERVFPLTEVVRGKNVFRTVVALETGEMDLQPGMNGDARVSSGWRPLGWSMLEPIVDRIRGFLWI
jgi:biotin carboxyl carrier protein